MDIRRCSAEDFGQICELLGQLWPGAEMATPSLRRSFERGLQSPTQVFLCAVNEKGVVGFCSLNVKNSLWQQGVVGHVDELVVDENHRRMGIGSALLGRAEEIAAELDCSRLELDSSHHRTRAHDLYESLGFENRAILFSKAVAAAGANLLVREVGLDDADAIVGILNPIIQSGAYSALDTPVTVDAERKFIRDFPRRGVFHVAEDRGESVGFQTLEPFATYTHAFDHVGVIATFVTAGRRGRGVGGRLSAATFEAARRKGYEKVFTFVRADNPAALQFYLSLGLQVVGTARKHARIGGEYVDEVIVEKLL